MQQRGRRKVEMKFDKNGESISSYVILLYTRESVTLDKAKVPTLIVVAKDPLQEVDEHNQGTSKQRFAGQNANAHCCLQQIIGPVDDETLALKIQQQWKSESRGLAGRAAKGRRLAEIYELPCFDANPDDAHEKSSKRTPRKRKLSASE